MYIAGGELTLFMPGIVSDKSNAERLQRLKSDPTC